MPRAASARAYASAAAGERCDEFGAHPDVLRALAGEDEGDGARARGACSHRSGSSSCAAKNAHASIAERASRAPNSVRRRRTRDTTSARTGSPKASALTGTRSSWPWKSDEERDVGLEAQRREPVARDPELGERLRVGPGRDHHRHRGRRRDRRAAARRACAPRSAASAGHSMAGRPTTGSTATSGADHATGGARGTPSWSVPGSVRTSTSASPPPGDDVHLLARAQRRSG